MPVTVSVDVPGDSPPVVESAAYFVVAEALANAGKHADARRVEIRSSAASASGSSSRSTTTAAAGANPEGGGLQRAAPAGGGARRTLAVRSPPGGPTTIRAELPCGS